MESAVRTRWMWIVFVGNPGGEDWEMGILSTLDQRMRSELIHLSLSADGISGGLYCMGAGVV